MLPDLWTWVSVLRHCIVTNSHLQPRDGQYTVGGSLSRLKWKVRFIYEEHDSRSNRRVMYLVTPCFGWIILLSTMYSFLVGRRSTVISATFNFHNNACWQEDDGPDGRHDLGCGIALLVWLWYKRISVAWKSWDPHTSRLYLRQMWTVHVKQRPKWSTLYSTQSTCLRKKQAKLFS